MEKANLRLSFVLFLLLFLCFLVNLYFVLNIEININNFCYNMHGSINNSRQKNSIHNKPYLNKQCLGFVMIPIYSIRHGKIMFFLHKSGMNWVNGTCLTNKISWIILSCNVIGYAFSACQQNGVCRTFPFVLKDVILISTNLNSKWNGIIMHNIDSLYEYKDQT